MAWVCSEIKLVGVHRPEEDFLKIIFDGAIFKDVGVGMAL